MEDRRKKTQRKEYLRRAAYLFCWWSKTLFISAIMPFIILAFIFWATYFCGSATMSNLHSILAQFVTGATPEQWVKSLSLAAFLLTLPMIIVIFLRLVSSKIATRIFTRTFDAIGRSLSSYAIRMLQRTTPSWATQEKAEAILVSIPVIIMFSGIIAMSVFGREGVDRKNEFPLPIYKTKPEPKLMTGVAITLPGEKPISGPAKVTRHGDS